MKEFGDIQEEIVEHLTSIRDFPMFEGDFFPDHGLGIELRHMRRRRGGFVLARALGWRAAGVVAPTMRRRSDGPRTLQRRRARVNRGHPQPGLVLAALEKRRAGGSSLPASHTSTHHCQCHPCLSLLIKT